MSRHVFLGAVLFLVVMLVCCSAFNDDRPIYKWSPLWFNRYFRDSQMYKRVCIQVVDSSNISSNNTSFMSCLSNTCVLFLLVLLLLSSSAFNYAPSDLNSSNQSGLCNAERESLSPSFSLKTCGLKKKIHILFLKKLCWTTVIMNRNKFMATTQLFCETCKIFIYIIINPHLTDPQYYLLWANYPSATTSSGPQTTAKRVVSIN